MTTIEAIVLGLIQGVFMFVPVSSTSHLALAQHVMGAGGSQMPAPESPEMILFDVVVHVGTLLSIVVVMWSGLARLATGISAELWQLVPARLRERGGRHRRRWAAQRLARESPPPERQAREASLPGREPSPSGQGPSPSGRVPSPAGQPRDRLYLRLFWLGMVTVATTGVLGLAVRAVGVDVFAAPALIAVALILTGAILWWTDTAGPQWRGARQLTVWVAVGIGVAQAAALLPGLSRSGLTIAMALLLGLYRPLAAQFSFFVAIPTILAVMVVQTVDVLRAQDGVLEISLSAYAVGFLVAAVVGAVALAGVLKLLYQARFRYFAVYVWVVAVVILVVQPPHLG